MRNLDRTLKAMAKWTTAAGLALGLAACGDSGGSSGTTTATDTATATDATATTEDTSVTPDVTTEDTTAVEETTADTAEPPADIVAPAECDHAPACSDQQIAALKLKDTASGGAIEALEAPEGEFLTHIDATAGGFNGTKGYTYAKFTPEGMVAVALSDEDALDDATWDIAFRRFVIRLNSGVSGPSCVVAAALQEGAEFGGVDAEPAGLDYEAESYFTGAGCTFIDDGSGIGGPGTVLAGYWSYLGCVSMTGTVYVLRLADGHHVKLQVEDYYEPAAQDVCDETGAVSNTSSAGNFRVRWAYLD